MFCDYSFFEKEKYRMSSEVFWILMLAVFLKISFVQNKNVAALRNIYLFVLPSDGDN